MPNKFFAHAMVAAVFGTAGLGIQAALSPAAMALSFNFSFTNTANPAGGTVTGIVEGLTDNATSAATSVQVLSNTAGFGLGEYVGSPNVNTWTLLGGGISSYIFLSFGVDNSSPAVTDSTLLFSDSSGGGLLKSPNSGFIGRNSGLTFTAVPVPTPALLPGLVGMGMAFLRKRQTKAVQVAEAG
jgi:hypothetical protein